MVRLFKFLYGNRVLFYFLFLEIIAYQLVVTYNDYQGAKFFKLQNQLAGSVYSIKESFDMYIGLSEENRRLSAENSQLKQQIANNLKDTPSGHDFISRDIYEVVPGRVVNNSVVNSRNYLTINKGTRDSVFRDMGVTGVEGVVGKIKSASDNYSVAISLLHIDYSVSSEIKNSGTLCTTQWDGMDITHSTVKYVPRHVNIQVGDTIQTSGFNAIYPKGLIIGWISSFDLKPNSTFYDIKIRLATDFSKLDYISVIQNKRKEEKDSLESKSYILQLDE